MILIIDKSAKSGKSIAEIFNYMGIVAKHASAESAIQEISNRYRAVIFVNPDRIPEPTELIKSARALSLGSSVFALCTDRSPSEKMKNLSGLFDAVYADDISSSLILKKITDYQKEMGLDEVGCYRLAGLDASYFYDGVYYFGEKLNFTKTETMIIRYLIRSYPNPASAASILKHAFNPYRTPELSNVRTHVSVINKKFRERTSRNLIGTSEAGAGYVILTPEMAGIISGEVSSYTKKQ